MPDAEYLLDALLGPVCIGVVTKDIDVVVNILRVVADQNVLVPSDYPKHVFSEISEATIITINRELDSAVDLHVCLRFNTHFLTPRKGAVPRCVPPCHLTGGLVFFGFVVANDVIGLVSIQEAMALADGDSNGTPSLWW
jgi:hypothetical protein